MTVSFMTAYWWSIALFALIVMVSLGGFGLYVEEGDPSMRTVRRGFRIIIAGAILLVVGAFLGVWLPVFVPGLY